MKLIVFGLTLSSSWGNGHATLWRGLVRALTRDGHQVLFFERDVEYYARHRDLTEGDEPSLVLYGDWESVLPRARRELADADAAIITSYCPDAQPASILLRDEHASILKVFYDLDTPVTLARLKDGKDVSYIPEYGLGDFDLALSYTGGDALDELQQKLAAPRVAALYGHVDPQTHFPVPSAGGPRDALSYLGTYAADRQAALNTLLLEPARRHPRERFVIGGSGYPPDFPWLPNIWFVQHVPPPEHPAFFAASRMTLNVTRADMAAMGYCPSGRLFEAAACGTPLLSDDWRGLEFFYTPGEELLIARTPDDVSAALAYSDEALARIAKRARERTLDQHTSTHRAREMVSLLEDAASPAMRRPARGARVEYSTPGS
jgi:spore maturation protein CgeB